MENTENQAKIRKNGIAGEDKADMGLANILCQCTQQMPPLLSRRLSHPLQ